MPPPRAFVPLGVFVRRGVLTPDECVALTAALRASTAFAAEVYGAPDAVDRTVRRAFEMEVDEKTQSDIRKRLEELRPELEAHFGTELDSVERPSFLRYDVGDFFRPHRDRPTQATFEEAPHTREISLVLFINDRTSDVHAGGYAGGVLRLFGLIDAKGADLLGLDCASEAGTAIAFRSDTIHEVTEVLAGQRCTIVTWFTRPGRPRPS